MKTPISIALFAVAALSATAATAPAQTPEQAPLKGEARFEIDALPQSWTGDAPIPVGTLPMKLQSNFDAKLPALPSVNQTQTAGVKLSVVPTYRGPMLQVEAADQSMKDVLQTVTDNWGIRAVIDPALSQQHFANAVFRAPTPQDLLDTICEFSVKQFSWRDGSLYFVDKVNADFTIALSENRANARLEKLIAEQQNQARSSDPFWINPAYKPRLTPQSDWEKREFNGHEFYYVPLPRP